MTAMQTIISKLSTLSTDKILACLDHIGGGIGTTEEMMVRAAMIQVYIQRFGEDAGDKLMEKMGMM